MSRRGQISIDKIVALRSSVLPFYIIIKEDGSVVKTDEVSEDGTDFLTTKMHGDQISFRSISGWYLTTEGGQITTRRYCAEDERFTVEKKDTQYAFRARNGKYLSVTDQCVELAMTCEDTEVFQLFSLMMYGVNVGKQLETLERTGMVMIDGLLEDPKVDSLRNLAAEASSGVCNQHETRTAGLTGRSADFAELATNMVVLQLVRRAVSPAVKLSCMESCRTDAEHVRKELEVTTWHVVHPYSDVEFPGVVDASISFTAVWFLDELTPENSTWAWVKAPLTDGAHSPQLPQLSSPEGIEAVTKDAKPLLAKRGACWLYLGPVWMSNNVGAASFWKDYDAQTRYKHLSGQKEQNQASFRSLTDQQSSAQPRDELCPTLIQATYVREYATTRDPPPAIEEFETQPALQQELYRLFNCR